MTRAVPKPGDVLYIDPASVQLQGPVSMDLIHEWAKRGLQVTVAPPPDRPLPPCHEEDRS